MASEKNKVFRVASYPSGMPAATNFELADAPTPQAEQGHLVIRTLYLAMEPYPRLMLRPDARIGGVQMFRQPLPLGATMVGRGIGQVVESRNAAFPEGAFVSGDLGWQLYARSDGTGLRRVDPGLAPLPAHLDILGASGLTAYFALLELGRPKAGETVLITSAAGSVGSAAVQIARLQGCRVVGVAGGAAKERYLLDTLGADAAIDYKGAASFDAAVRATCPDGVDVFFDNVGGSQHDAVMAQLCVGARIVMVGTMAGYNDPEAEANIGPRHLYTLIVKRAHMSGFLVGDHAARFPEALAALGAWLKEGRIEAHHTIVQGFERTPQAFADLFAGAATGKLLVQVARDPSAAG